MNDSKEAMNVFAYIYGETTTIKGVPLSQPLQKELAAMFEELMESYQRTVI